MSAAVSCWLGVRRFCPWVAVAPLAERPYEVGAPELPSEAASGTEPESSKEDAAIHDWLESWSAAVADVETEGSHRAEGFTKFELNAWLATFGTQSFLGAERKEPRVPEALTPFGIVIEGSGQGGAHILEPDTEEPSPDATAACSALNQACSAAASDDAAGALPALTSLAQILHKAYAGSSTDAGALRCILDGFAARDLMANSATAALLGIVRKPPGWSMQTATSGAAEELGDIESEVLEAAAAAISALSTVQHCTS
mmetsp:Transcript_1232/g.1959  ORF Transcript_1232/g.1959 Transcript_1232/m.1959 type:complete len:257 (-) Transcript_1232:217-987(-)|eukprot:CAMPEP_0115088102 /NCGR_PEP_ID=MMETSP0227-20121206/23768_1 /TAXON_ID=89957 /ORGANISM="Polarella glacialis, Strain CCMP 1383" /LENGTH=256 /DNA_ID=CAMNT_0002478261 /DNA_START=49 /DNA_END=819 /DNA_ORIENTATION=+